MNTTRQTLFPTTAIDLWAGVQTLARFLAHRVVAQRPASAVAESMVLHLNKGATTWITRPQGRKVTCESGVLWLCFDGEPEDIVLEPGATHCCEKASPLSIHALSAGAVRLA